MFACDWLSGNDTKHTYRLPTEEDWILGAGHMPKDVVINNTTAESSTMPSMGIRSPMSIVSIYWACWHFLHLPLRSQYRSHWAQMS